MKKSQKILIIAAVILVLVFVAAFQIYVRPQKLSAIIGDGEISNVTAVALIGDTAGDMETASLEALPAGDKTLEGIVSIISDTARYHNTFKKPGQDGLQSNIIVTLAGNVGGNLFFINYTGAYATISVNEESTVMAIDSSIAAGLAGYIFAAANSGEN